jgi:hypothetical protein
MPGRKVQGNWFYRCNPWPTVQVAVVWAWSFEEPIPGVGVDAKQLSLFKCGPQQRTNPTYVKGQMFKQTGNAVPSLPVPRTTRASSRMWMVLWPKAPLIIGGLAVARDGSLCSAKEKTGIHFFLFSKNEFYV